jgi:subtilisin family serine protease
VGAVGPSGPAPFTNYGPWVRACAPGVDVVSRYFQGFDGPQPTPASSVDPDLLDGWARWSGTSFAAPFVVAALAREMVVRGVSAGEAVARIIDGPGLLRLPDLGTVVT